MRVALRPSGRKNRLTSTGTRHNQCYSTWRLWSARVEHSASGAIVRHSLLSGNRDGGDQRLSRVTVVPDVESRQNEPVPSDRDRSIDTCARDERGPHPQYLLVMSEACHYNTELCPLFRKVTTDHSCEVIPWSNSQLSLPPH